MLRDYQKQDVEKLMSHCAMGLFNEQRTGKTPTSISVMKQRGCTRVLIICTNSMLYTWKEEYEKWAGSPAIVVETAKQFLDRTFKWDGALIIGYGLIQNKAFSIKFTDKVMRFIPEGLIVDEAHRCKTISTNTFHTVNRLKRISYRLYLTGTPAPNRAYEVWALLHYILPEKFNSYYSFVDKFCTTKAVRTPTCMITQPEGIKKSMESELNAILQEYCCMRKRDEVMTWLKETPTELTVIKLECTKQQQKYLKEIEDTFCTEHVNTINILDRLTRTRQICSAPEMLGLKSKSPKLDWITQYLKEYSDKSILLFSNSTKLLELLVSRAPHVQLITGKTKPTDRAKYISGFQQQHVKVLGIQTQAGKEGLTLDQADVTIFLDTFPPAASYEQAKDRMVTTQPERIKPKEIIHLMMRDTYDEQLYNLVEKRIDETQVVNDYINYFKRKDV